MDYPKLRKYEHTLAISGAAVVAFGIWTVIKAVIYFFLIPLEQVGAEVKEISDVSMDSMQSLGITDRGLGVAYVIIMLLFLLMDLALRFYVGRRALLDGRGEKKNGVVYVVVAAFLSVLLVMDALNKVRCLVNPEEARGLYKMMASADVSLIIDLTSLFALIEVIIASIMVRRLRAQMEVE